MRLIALALRNLARNRRRTLGATASIAVGVVALALISGFVSSIRHALYTQIVRAEGHVQIMVAGALDFAMADPGHYALADWQGLAARLRADPVLAPQIAEIAPVLRLAGVAGHATAGTSRSFVAIGLDPAAQARMQGWDDFALGLAPNRLDLDPAAPDAVLLGLGLARQLQVCVALTAPGCTDLPRAAAASGPVSAEALDLGALAAAEIAAPPPGTAQIDLMVAGAEGAPNARSYRLRGIAEQARRQADNGFVAMTLPAAQDLMWAGADRVSAVMVQFRHAADAGPGLARIRALLPGEGLDILPMERFDESFARILAMFTTIQLFIGAVVGLIILLMIANTMAMVVIERTAEVGLLRAIGESRAGIAALFLAEGVLLGAFAGAVGLGLSALTIAALNAAGLSFTPPTATAPIPLRLLFWQTPGVIAAIWGLVVAVAAISALWPARRASGTDIVSALRFA